MTAEDILSIQMLIARFANSFDVKDWDGLGSCFTEKMNMDYPNSVPATVSASDYVVARHRALESTPQHHLIGNYEVEFTSENDATCRASMTIWRKMATDDCISHCVYFFQLRRENDNWKICGIKQDVLWSGRYCTNDGIH